MSADRDQWREQRGDFERRRTRAELEQTFRDQVADGSLRVLRVDELDERERARYALAKHAAVRHVYRGSDAA